jgi:hypothetical protein
MIRRCIAVFAVVAALLAWSRAPTPGQIAGPGGGGTPTYQILREDVLINADIWDTRPRMIAAGLGFTNIIGVPGLTTDDLATSEALARAAGGAWNVIHCAPGETPDLAAYTSASTPQAVAFTFGFPIASADGLPVEFSWPIRPSTLDPTDFEVTLNTGEKVTPQLASIYPNEEYNERSVAVLFGKFGNRLPPTDPGSVYVVAVKVVGRLQLVGPGGRLASAVGFEATTMTTPYADPNVPPDQRTGPRLCGAKLSHLSARGDFSPLPFHSLANSGVALYGKEGRFRLRVYTTGGFSPDGVRAVFPTEFARYFRLHARGAGGRDVVITETGVTYHVAGQPLRVIGLADLGPKASVYDDCYREDKDNFIDIILAGSEAAARRITHVEIPAAGVYSPFYNPGGPGNSPTPGVRYTSPGPSQLQPVLIALDNPMTVTYIHGPVHGPFAAGEGDGP